jgi:hypothetical protein
MFFLVSRRKIISTQAKHWLFNEEKRAQRPGISWTRLGEPVGVWT